jgi:hypothetical protein
MSMPLLRGLFDDAATFPPASVPLPTALSDHSSQPPLITGRFLIRASMLSQLPALGRTELAVGVIADTGVAGLPEAVAAARALPAWANVETLEVALLPEGELVAEAIAAVDAVDGSDLQLYVELPHEARAPLGGWDEVIEVLAEGGAGAKLRTGGLAPEAFPSVREVAEFITACVSAGVPYKCTAGLHRAVRRAEQHGFLNLLVATHAAVRGEDVEATLAEVAADVLVRRVRSLDETAAKTVRTALTAIGSCSLTEPWEDLLALGLVQA